jgi:hypothetical protein
MVDAMSDSTVHVLETAIDASAEVRKALADTIDFVTQLHGKHLSGFSIVAWDSWGNGVPVSFHARTSPLSDDLVPVYAMNMLQQQNTLLKTAELADEPPKPKE